MKHIKKESTTISVRNLSDLNEEVFQKTITDHDGQYPIEYSYSLSLQNKDRDSDDVLVLKTAHYKDSSKDRVRAYKKDTDWTAFEMKV